MSKPRKQGVGIAPPSVPLAAPKAARSARACDRSRRTADPSSTDAAPLSASYRGYTTRRTRPPQEHRAVVTAPPAIASSKLLVEPWRAAGERPEKGLGDTKRAPRATQRASRPRAVASTSVSAATAAAGAASIGKSGRDVASYRNGEAEKRGRSSGLGNGGDSEGHDRTAPAPAPAPAAVPSGMQVRWDMDHNKGGIDTASARSIPDPESMRVSVSAGSFHAATAPVQLDSLRDILHGWQEMRSMLEPVVEEVADTRMELLEQRIADLVTALDRAEINTSNATASWELQLASANMAVARESQARAAAEANVSRLASQLEAAEKTVADMYQEFLARDQKETKLRERLSSLESVVDFMTLAQTSNSETRSGSSAEAPASDRPGSSTLTELAALHARTQAQVMNLQSKVHELEAQLAARDSMVLALKDRIASLEVMEESSRSAAAKTASRGDTAEANLAEARKQLEALRSENTGLRQDQQRTHAQLLSVLESHAARLPSKVDECASGKLDAAEKRASALHKALEQATVEHQKDKAFADIAREEISTLLSENSRLRSQLTTLRLEHGLSGASPSAPPVRQSP